MSTEATPGIECIRYVHMYMHIMYIYMLTHIDIGIHIHILDYRVSDVPV